MGPPRRTAGGGRNSSDLYGYRRSADRFRLPADPRRARSHANSGDRLRRSRKTRAFSRSARNRRRGPGGLDLPLRDVHRRPPEILPRRASRTGAVMIFPCIDLMDGKVVQLVQGREKALEGDTPLVMLRRFAAFPEIQVIDLDAAMGAGSNDDIVELLASRAKCRVGGGVRSAERARTLVGQGAWRVIVGTAAFSPALAEITAAIGRERVIIALDSKDGRIVVKGWREATNYTAEQVLKRFEPYCSGFLCTYVDKEGMMQGTDLDWFRRLRAGTSLELTAAGGITTIEEVRELQQTGVNATLGMAIYTGKLDLTELAAMQA